MTQTIKSKESSILKKEKEIVEEIGQLDQMVIREIRRPNGTIRRTTNFETCTSRTEQHTAHLTDLNYLIAKYKPDELTAYIMARNQHRMEILGHDFSQEPSLLDAKNTVYKIRTAFESLPREIKVNFDSHVDFMKFIDNPHNKEKMIKLGLLKESQIEQLTGETTKTPVNTTTTTQEEKK